MFSNAHGTNTCGRTCKMKQPGPASPASSDPTLPGHLPSPQPGTWALGLSPPSLSPAASATGAFETEIPSQLTNVFQTELLLCSLLITCRRPLLRGSQPSGHLGPRPLPPGSGPSPALSESAQAWRPHLPSEGRPACRLPLGSYRPRPAHCYADMQGHLSRSLLARHWEGVAWTRARVLLSPSTLLSPSASSFQHGPGDPIP